MAPQLEPGWHELQIPSRKECPKLFYLFTPSKDSLLLLLTDLISIWQCSLDKFGIIAEANRQHASIDPSDSDAQFNVLLSKLSQSLQDGQNTLARDDKRTSNDLHLITQSDLPRPLRPLKWTFRISQQDTSELAERLLRPSLHEVSVSEAKITSLMDTIKEKDHIISRLLDRIGTSGVDLGLIFPSISGIASRKGGQLSVTDAQKHISGMAAFDENSWIKRFATDDGYEGFDRTGLKNLLDQTKVETKSSSSATRLKGQTESSAKRAPKPSSDTTDSDGDFERQPTPPSTIKAGTRSKITSPPLSPANKDEGSEDDTDPPEQTSAKKWKIGGLRRSGTTKASGDKTKWPSPPQKPAASSSNRASSVSSGTPTASETESESETDQPNKHSKSGNAHSRQKATDSENRSNRKRRLGGLGKQKVSLSSARSSSPSRSPPPRRGIGKRSTTPDGEGDPKASTPLSSRRLGRLTKPSAPSPEASSDEDEDDDLDAPPKTRSQQVKQPQKSPSTTPPRRLGRLGGKSRHKDTSPSPTAMSRSSKRKPASAAKKDAGGDVDMQEDKEHGTDTESGTDTAGPSPDRPDAARRTSGRAKQSISKSQGRHVAPDASTDEEPATPSSSARTKSATLPARDAGGSSSAAQQPEQEETAEQKADRRRLELKRNIAGGVGVKKKRRF